MDHSSLVALFRRIVLAGPPRSDVVGDRQVIKKLVVAIAKLMSLVAIQIISATRWAVVGRQRGDVSGAVWRRSAEDRGMSGIDRLKNWPTICSDSSMASGLSPADRAWSIEPENGRGGIGRS